jgi:hypothetical protein
MALPSLNVRQRGELEDLAVHAALAKEPCRAQALLWLAGGADVSEVAELLLVIRQSVYNWVRRFRERAGPGLRAGLLDATRPGRPRAAGGAIDGSVAAVIDGNLR